MITIGSLWLAILVSAALVWVCSFLVWTVFPHHKSDYNSVPDEEAVRKALGQDISPGQYNIPHMESMDALKDPENVKKFADGPVGFLTIAPSGPPTMSKKLILTFSFYLIVGIIVAYLLTRTLDAGSDYLSVFRIAGTTAWLAYGFGAIQDGIWFGRPWSYVGKNLFDALLYALLTAGTFGWLWPA